MSVENIRMICISILCSVAIYLIGIKVGMMLKDREGKDNGKS